ncbi:MAG: hypothetical protein HRT45_04330 [Bdellovibrionales bacterium]|nr:hypothetical protein [Bdellovibrionales bacterium]
MPNVIIEHSKNIQETRQLMQICHDHLMESGLFKIETIKVRHQSFENYLVGGSSTQPFVVFTLSIMPGKRIPCFHY